MTDIELDIYNNTINLWIEEARSRTNKAAARNLLAHYVQCIERGTQPPAALLVYVAEAFAEVLLNDKSFEQASGLKVKTGCTSKKGRNFDLYSEYWLAERAGGKSTAIILELSQKYDLTEIAIRKIIEPIIGQMRESRRIV